jgi:hypothetical protein
MSRIFLSHASRDNFVAVAIGDWLKDEGWDHVFLDLDTAQRWERTLYEHAAECEAVRFFGMTVSACRSTPKGWRKAASSGHRRRTA